LDFSAAGVVAVAGSGVFLLPVMMASIAEHRFLHRLIHL
jgi:hypothetical protein